MATITEYRNFVEQMGFVKAISVIIIASIMGFFAMTVIFTWMEDLSAKITSEFNQ